MAKKKMKLVYDIVLQIPEDAIRNMEKELLKAKFEGMHNLVRGIATDLHAKARRDFTKESSGRLAKSIKFKAEMKPEGAVGTINMLKYGKIIELGRVKGRGGAEMPPRPWITPIIDGWYSSGKVRKALAVPIQKALKRLSETPRKERKIKGS